MPDVVDSVTDHRRTLDTHAECEAGVFNRIDFTEFKDSRMHHSGSEDFDPSRL